MLSIPRPLIPIDLDELYKLRVVERWTYRKLAKHFGVSDTTLINRCKDNSFPGFRVAKKINKQIKIPRITRKKVKNKTADKKLKELFDML